MEPVTVFLLSLASLVIIGIGALPFLFIIGYFQTRREERPTTTPSVCVIVPCKGKGEGLRENLQALCRQKYPAYRLLFVLDSPQDPAFPVVSEVIQGLAHTRLEYAVPVPGTSGKISALLTGIDRSADAEILVFADSDIRPHPDWLTDLVAPLTDAKVGASTGYRWFFATNLKSALISTWSLSTVSAMFYQITTFAWGGSTAVRKSLFQELGIATRWRQGLSDDLILTHAMKKAKYKIRFVPQCVAESPAEPSIRNFIQWGSQQLTWIRWYSLPAWIIYYLGVLFVTAVLAMDAVLFVLGDTVFGIFFLATIGLEIIYGWIGLLTFQRLMRYPAEKFRYRIWYGLLAPIAFLLYAYNAVVSSVKREIRWCGKTYRKKDLADLKAS